MSAQTSKSMTTSKTLMHIKSFTFHYFCRALGINETKFDLITVQIMKIIWKLWKLESSSRSFCVFDKMAI